MRSIRNWYQLLEQSGLVANDSGPGVAQGTLTANVTRLPWYCPLDTPLIITGPLTPDATGSYTCFGSYNGFPYWFQNGYYIWSDLITTPFWLISAALGDPGPASWTRDDPSPTGSYEPQDAAIGTATASSPLTMPNGYKGVTFAASASRIVTPAAAGFPSASGSIETLVRPSWPYTDGLAHILWDTYDGNSKRFCLRKNADNTTELLTNTESRGTFTFPWATSSLYHIVLNWGTNVLYINGTAVKDFTDGTLGIGASNLYIGDRYALANNSWKGQMFYFIVRDAVLTAAEIAEFRSLFSKLYTA